MRSNRLRRQTLRRRWLLSAITMLSILSTASITLAAAPASPLPPPTLVGAWQVQFLSIRGSDGNPVQFSGGENRCSLIVTEKTMTLRVGGEIMAQMSYTADKKRAPSTIDAKSADGRMLGIFMLIGDNLRINLNDEVKGRPRDFNDQGGMILALRRYVGLPLFVINADGTGLRQILSMPEFTTTGSPDWSHDGSKITLDASRPLFGENWVGSHVFVVNADGSGLKDLGPGGMPSWSPDDKQITYSQYTPQNGVWIMNADGSGRRRLDPNGWGSQWSPKHNEIAYLSRDGGANLCVYDLATQKRRNLLEKKYKQVYEGFSWSPDGGWISFKGDLPAGGSEIAAVSAEGEKKGFKILLPASAWPESQNVSKTMSWGGTGGQILVAMRTSVDQLPRLYILDFAGGDRRLLPGIPADWASDDAAWSPDGKRIAFCAQPSARSAQGTTGGGWATVTAVGIYPYSAPAPQGNTAKMTQSQNNLKMLALAMHNYAQANRCFPPAVLYGPDGKTPYSWRIALLPYMEDQDIYKRYHFDEPWDGPNNRQLLKEVPAVFRCPTEPAGSTNASYFAVVGPGTMFDGKAGTTFAEIQDGTSNTILLVEAKRDIPWTKPEDISYDSDKPLPKFGGHFKGRFSIALADGSVRWLPSTISDKVLRALLTKAGREVVQVPDERE